VTFVIATCFFLYVLHLAYVAVWNFISANSLKIQSKWDADQRAEFRNLLDEGEGHFDGLHFVRTGVRWFDFFYNTFTIIRISWMSSLIYATIYFVIINL